MLNEGSEKEQSYEEYLRQAAERECEEDLFLAEMLYQKADEAATDEEECKLVETARVLFYFRQEMYLKAEHAAREMIEKYPDNYIGHHLLFLIWQKKNCEKEMEQHFLEIREQFGEQLQFLRDYWDVLKDMEDRQEAVNSIIENYFEKQE